MRAQSVPSGESDVDTSEGKMCLPNYQGLRDFRTEPSVYLVEHK